MGNNLRFYINLLPNNLIEDIEIRDLKEHISDNQKSNKMKAIVFSRVSCGHQDLDQQTIKVKEQALKDGYSEENLIYIEEVESAVKLSEEERNGLNKLKYYINNDSSIDCVYVYEISRISRQAQTVFSIRDYLLNHKVQLVIMNPFFKMLKDDGSFSETSNIFFGIFASLAEQEGYLRKARIKKAVDKNRALGLHTGGNKMFGYTTNDKHEYIINHNQADIVTEIFDMYVNKQMSIRRIARELSDRGIKMQTIGKNDNPNSTYLTMCVNINNILKRKEYIGEVIGKPAIITKEIFDKAQQIMKKRTICATRKEVPALLRGILYDKPSGWLLSANYNSRYYYSKRAKGGASISFECADKIIWDYCKKMYNKMSDNDFQALYHTLEEKYRNYMIKQYKMADKVNKLKTQIDLVEERIIIGKISKEKADELERKYEKELNEAKNAAIEYDNERRNVQKQMVQLQEHHEHNDEIDLDNMPIERMIETVHDIVNKIYITRISRIEALIEIEGKYSNEEYRVDTYHKCIIE